MSDKRHTPEPWEAAKDESRGDGAWNVWAKDDGEYADEGDELIVAGFMTEANARLAAQSPYLLKFLKQAVSHAENECGVKGDIRPLPRWVHNARIAIDKATTPTPNFS